MDLREIRTKFEQKVGRRNQIASDLEAIVAERKQVEKEIGYSEKAQAIIQAVAQATQQELQYRITEPVSLALASVYQNPYKMVAEFQITGRGTTECNLGFERNGNIIKPLEASGGGPIDIASFALRVGSWSLQQPRSRNVLILDEPFKWVQRDKIPLCSQMLQEVSLQLQLQIIMVSHFPELIEEAANIIWVFQDKKEVSSIKFSGDIKAFVSFLSQEREQLQIDNKRPSEYQKHLYKYFLEN